MVVLDTICDEGSIKPFPMFAYAKRSLDGTLNPFTAAPAENERLNAGDFTEEQYLDRGCIAKKSSSVLKRAWPSHNVLLQSTPLMSR